MLRLRSCCPPPSAVVHGKSVPWLTTHERSFEKVVLLQSATPRASVNHCHFKFCSNTSRSSFAYGHEKQHLDSTPTPCAFLCQFRAVHTENITTMRETRNGVVKLSSVWLADYSKNNFLSLFMVTCIHTAFLLNDGSGFMHRLRNVAFTERVTSQRSAIAMAMRANIVPIRRGEKRFQMPHFF